jgi:hypothetical protein
MPHELFNQPRICKTSPAPAPYPPSCSPLCSRIGQ